MHNVRGELAFMLLENELAEMSEARGLEKRKTVLIVDDDATILRTFAHILNRNGYCTDDAMSVQQALAKLQDNRCDVALIDMRLPDSNGADLLARMPDKAAKMVKIIITGFPTIENYVEAGKNGVDACMQKPIQPERLLSLMSKLTGKEARRPN